jgi:putative mRNA 3-end processing factor
MGYPLGKAQLLSYFFSSWEPLFVHGSVAAMNSVHARHGVALKRGSLFDPTKDIDAFPRGPWTMIAPLLGGRSRLMSHLKRKYGAVLAAFSGWALRAGYSSSLAVDFAFPLSDHCDYPELMRLVQEVSPELVYTTHGFAAEFASDLRKVGFPARTLSPYQSSLSDYMSAD